MVDRYGAPFGEIGVAGLPPHPALRATFTPVKNGGEETPREEPENMCIPSRERDGEKAPYGLRNL